MTAVNLLLIAGLGGFYAFWATGKQSAALPYLFFIYVQLVPGLSTAMLWLLAGYIYDSRQSKRVFPFLGAGAIVGAMAGSIIPSFLSDYLSTTSMIGISCAMLGGLSLLAWVIWRYGRPDAERVPAKRFEDRETRAGDAFRVVANSRLLTLMVLSVFLVIAAAQVADWQVSDTTKKAFAHLPPMSNGPINEIGGIWPHNRYACSNRRCGWTGYREDLLHAFDPFNSGCALVACPLCKEQNIHTCCDEPGCCEPDTCGTPTPYGYRRTCWKHHPDNKKEEEKQ